MALSPTAVESAFASNTDKVWVEILTISHPSLVQPIRVVKDTVDLVSRGNTYIAYPFEIELPLASAEEMAEAQLSIDNVDRSIADALGAIDGPATVTLEVVLTAEPDTVVYGPFELVMQDVDIPAAVVTARLSYEDILSEPFPAETFSPARYPGLF